MRKRIEELARGRFKCAEPILAFSVERIELEVSEGKNLEGEFTITSTNQIPMLGMVYSSNPRMECLTPRFEGEEVRIRYEFHSEGLIEGDIQKGDFFIVCNQGEYNLSFVVLVTKLYARSNQGSIQGLKDFAELAQNNWGEARKIFYSACFPNIIKRQEIPERLLYYGIAKGLPTDQNMEEFLLAAKRKSKVQVRAEETELQFYHVTEVIRQSIVLQKSSWGYVKMEMSSDAAFLEPEKRYITTEDFIGSQAEPGFYLNPDHMHGGKNFGCLILKNIHQQIVIRVCATMEEEGVLKSQKPREIKELHVKVLNLYVEYRLKKIVTGKWAAKTCGLLDELTALKPDNVWYRLIKAQILLINRQRQDAEWILSDFKRKCRDRKSPQWGYYLYICTLMEKEEVYVDRLTEEIEQIFLEHRENTVLFWCLLFMREEYAQDRYQKLRALEERIMEGYESPLLYVEAYCLFCQEPYLMRHFGEFELKILNWARKQKMLTQDLAEQVLVVFPERLEYQRLVLLLLEACYEQCSNEQMLGMICSYLIKNQKYGKRFFPWYEKGVEEKIRITGLYEAYLMSMDARSIREVPKIILMYFKYNNQLGYRQKAILYVNIIANKERQPEIYEQYRQAMEDFAYEQMERKHVDDNLAVIYEEVVSRGIYSAELSDVLANVLFVHKLTCFEPDAVRLIVTQKQLQKPQVVPLVNGCACFPLYSNDYCIFVEDKQGNRYSGSVDYQLEKLMYPGRYLRACMQYSPRKLPYLLYYFANREAQGYFEERDLEYFKTVIEDERVSRVYQAWLIPKMFRLLQQMGRTREMEQELDRIDLSLLTPEDRGYLLEVLIDNQIYTRAYRMVEDYGIERISGERKVLLLDARIQSVKGAEEDELVKFCGAAFMEGQYSEAIIRYLCKYYQSTTKWMASLWKSAQVYQADTSALEERMLEQMLYTAEFVDCAAEIFKSYEAEGDPKLKEAYMTYFSWHSFVNSGIPPEHLFENLRKWYLEGHEMNAVCELTLLKYYAEKPEQQKQEKCIVERLLKKYLFQGMYFAFYRQFGSSLKRKYQMNDKCYIEHHAKRNKRVLIHYKMRDMDMDYRTEEMTEMYEGIFVKELLLFSGEAVQYYISEEAEEGVEVTASGQIVCEDVWDEAQKCCYDMLNEMFWSKTVKDEDKLALEMKQYQYLKEQTEQRFTII